MEYRSTIESTASKTCSLQNKTLTSCKPKASRKRGISAVLQDATNLGVSCNSIVDHRACKYKAVERWQEQMPKACKPRGDPAAGPPARTDNNNREHVSTAKTTPPAENIEATSLYRIFHHHKVLFDLGKTSISNFIEGNATWETKKAFAIQILVTGMNIWGLGILDASKLAADVLGVSPESIRRWANHYFVSLGSQFSSDNVTRGCSGYIILLSRTHC